MEFGLVWASLDVNLETRNRVQVVCVGHELRKHGRWGREMASQLPPWAPADLGKRRRTCLGLIPPRVEGTWDSDLPVATHYWLRAAQFWVFSTPVQDRTEAHRQRKPPSQMMRSLQCVHCDGEDWREVGEAPTGSATRLYHSGSTEPQNR